MMPALIAVVLSIYYMEHHTEMFRHRPHEENIDIKNQRRDDEPSVNSDGTDKNSHDANRPKEWQSGTVKEET